MQGKNEIEDNERVIKVGEDEKDDMGRQRKRDTNLTKERAARK